MVLEPEKESFPAVPQRRQEDKKEKWPLRVKTSHQEQTEHGGESGGASSLLSKSSPNWEKIQDISSEIPLLMLTRNLSRSESTLRGYWTLDL